MANKKLLFVVLALALTFLVFIGCKTEATDVFAGTWKGTIQMDSGQQDPPLISINLTITAAGGAYTAKGTSQAMGITDPTDLYKGTYTTSENNATFTFTHVDSLLIGQAKGTWLAVSESSVQAIIGDILPDGKTTHTVTVSGNTFSLYTGGGRTANFTKQ
jgi:hypothetical protein